MDQGPALAERPSMPPTLSSPPLQQVFANGINHLNPVSRVLSPASVTGTPRSSGEFYSMSNNSSETLASEYVPQILARSRPTYGRKPSHIAQVNYQRSSEILMMGYAQIMGSFTVDGSLVNQAPFEEVKRKGVMSGQGGGGVVGVESNKRNSGLFGALSWGSLGESIGDLLGGGELSSIKEMKGVANSKSVPILTTPQSILFVDLHLRPGESKSFTYCHPLPKGIPPSHKGRAIKITYNLIVGTQRAQTAHQQHHIRHIELPFKVLPGINGMTSIHKTTQLLC